jgi:RNA polymerase sigma factor (sigma-70 family)
VKTKESAGRGKDVRFRTTQWDVVFNARNADSSQQGRCLSDLCSRYWFPLYKFALFTGLSHEDAQDLTQSFFLYLLQKKSLRHVDPAKGRFRSFLLASFRNHLSTHRQYRSAAKRGGGKPSIELDSCDAKESHHLEPADHLTAETFFDANWAQLLIERVTLRLGEEYRQRGKWHQFDRLQCHLQIGSEPDAKSYEEAGRLLGMSSNGVKTLVFRMRQRFAALMRQEVAQTLLNPRDTDAEIHALYSALRSTEGRLRDELGTR